jgi:hypothetical protein
MPLLGNDTDGAITRKRLQTFTLTAAATGVTLLGVAGMAAVAAASSATFVGVFTAANTVSIYRK